jgi:hypothetical protein
MPVMLLYRICPTPALASQHQGFLQVIQKEQLDGQFSSPLLERKTS